LWFAAGGSLAKDRSTDALFVVLILPDLKRLFRRANDALWTEAYRQVNRFRHAALQRRAVEQLSAAERPRRILLICNANLCRSPYLEAVLRRNLADIEIRSAGIFGAGRRVQPDALVAAQDRGVDLSAHRSRLLNAAMLESADLVIVMEPRQARLVTSAFRVPSERVIVAGDLDPDAGEPRMIVDPWGREPAAYAQAFARLERCALQLVLLLPQAKG
jgi:protein-tyrosine phosphatase